MPEAPEAMLPFLKEEFGNPSNLHGWEKHRRRAVDEARERCPRISMTKWLVAENFLASTPCAFAVFSMSQRGIR